MALSANKVTGQGRVSGRTIDLTIKNAAVIYTGALVAVDNNGALPIAAATASLRYMGVAIRGGTGNAGGTVKCVVERRGTGVYKKTTATAADLGKLAYAVDDETVTPTAPSGSGGNDYIVGRIIRIVDSANVEVDHEDRVA